jgi:hypothetical protein
MRKTVLEVMNQERVFCTGGCMPFQGNLPSDLVRRGGNE